VLLVNASSANGLNVEVQTIEHSKILYFDESCAVQNSIQDSTQKDYVDIDALADSLTRKVLGENRVVDALDPEKTYTLPLGLVKDIGGVSYVIVLDELTFTPSGAVMKAYMSLSLPGSSKKIGLVADEVKVGVNGIEAAKLKMLHNREQDFLGQNIEIIADSTYVEWDCNGYKGLQLTAKMGLSPKVFKKINTGSGSTVIGDTVKARISCYAEDLNDIIINASLDPFQLTKLDGYSFYPEEIVIDLSDKRNVDGMVFPPKYNSVFFDGNDKSLWRGLYIKSLKMQLPKKFARGGIAPKVAAQNFLIDIEGISGNLSYSGNLLSLEQGKIGGWKFSVNSISLSLEKNHISGYGMEGGILLPITEPNKPLDYKASIDANSNFLFRVSLPGSINAPVFGDGTSLNLDSNSKITVAYKDGEYYPKAELNGTMNVKVSSSGIDLANIAFQGLVVQTVEPKIDIKGFSMTSGAMSGFPVQINNIELERDIKDSLLGLRFDATANLMKESLNGSTQFVVWAKNENDQGWRYKETELRGILIDAKTSVFELKGALANYKNDATYGNGYYGYVNMSVEPGITVEAAAQFGNVNGTRYWFADAGVALPTGIPVLPGFAIYGFGGGAYYHMSRTMPTEIKMEEQNGSKVQDSTTVNKGKNQSSSPFKLGETPSGVKYTPSSSVGLGVLASVIIGTAPKPNAFNGTATFGIEFNSSGGVNKISFNGDGRFMTDLKDKSEPKVRATVNIEYVFRNKELFGNAKAYFNVANVVKGSGANNLAGEVSFYFARSDWYIYVGTPTNPVGLEFMGFLKSKSYLMLGSLLPDFPSLPSEVSNLSKDIDFSNLRNQELARNAGGFAFGASIRANTGEREFLIFYGKFDMGAGFDIMLTNYGSEAHCEGRAGSLGVNGWYAQGQAWAWVDASIGIKVKVFGKKKKFNFMDAGFAAVLAAQLPNPTYLAGAVEADYNVLGGLVKGKCHFEFSVGEQCKLVGGSAVEGVTAIAQLMPRANESDVDVFVTPQVIFNIPVNKEFAILDNDGITKKFRLIVDYCRIEHNGRELSARQEWNSQKDVLALKPIAVLPGEATLKFVARVKFQVYENRTWQDYKVNGVVETEYKEITFKTGPAPDYITENNVEYTYPVRNMVNFYKNEYGKCYIKVGQDIAYLFNKPGNWRYEAHFKSGENTSIVPVNYLSNEQRVEFVVPDNLVNEAIYTLKVVRVEDTNKRFVADKNVMRSEKVLSQELTLTKKEAEEKITDESITELYSLLFRTSKFNTFGEKLNGLHSSYTYVIISNNIKQLHIKFQGSPPDYELFDSYEQDIIKVQAVLDETPWYTDNYKDLVYKRYPLADGLEITYRDVSIVGVPPVNTASMVGYGTFPNLDEASISIGKVIFNDYSINRIEHNICYYVSTDWAHLRGKSFNISSSSADVVKLRNSTYQGLYWQSNYPVLVKYYIPGNAEPTSTYKLNIRY
jgi:hypothetical protein